jgi:hypothetical protein
MEATPQTHPDVADLPGLLIQSEFMYLRLARALIDCEPYIAGWRDSVVERAIECKARDGRLVLEISADKSGAATVALVAVAPNGARVVLDTLREEPASAAN